jgi:nucleoside-diphosphate-sugar epimerase
MAALIQEGWNAVGLVRSPPGEHPKGWRLIHGDLGRLPGLELPDVFGGELFTLIHLAWDLVDRYAWAAQAQQVSLFAALLDRYWQRLECLVSLGSADEFGSRGGRIGIDDAPEGVFNPYGWAKRASRDLVKAWAGQTHRSAVWLRPFVVYGGGQTGEMLIPYAVAQVRTGRIATFGDGTQQRDFIHVDDVVTAIIAALNIASNTFQEVNLGAGKPVEISYVLQKLSLLMGGEHLFRMGARPPVENVPSIRYADISSAQRLLGWQPTIDLDQGLKELVLYDS